MEAAFEDFPDRMWGLPTSEIDIEEVYGHSQQQLFDDLILAGWVHTRSGQLTVEEVPALYLVRTKPITEPLA